MNRTMLHSTVAARAFATTPPVRVREPRGLDGPSSRQLAAIRKAAEQFDGTVDGDAMLKRSPESAEMLDYWDKVDAICDGIKAMRKNAETYLPKFPDEATSQYDLRKNLTKFTNVYRDTVEVLASKPFEQEVSIVGDNVDPQIAKFIENVDGAGNNLTQFLSLTMFNGINSSIDWIMVDRPPLDPTVRNRADEKARGIRTYWSHVLGRNVLWAQAEMIDGKETLVYVKIYEPGSPDRVRVFTRNDDGTVVWQLFEKQDQQVDGRTKFLEVSQGTVTIKEIPLVPFATGRRDGRTFRYFPPMQDAADLQIELFQQESALKFVKTMGGYMMLAGNGVKPDKDSSGNILPVTVAPMGVLYAPPDGNGNSGTWSFIQPSAEVMKFLADDSKETIAQLRELGRQPLTAQSGNLTVITAAAAAGKARTVVGAWAYGLKDAAENAMRLTVKFDGITSGEPEVNVYTEFDEFAEGKDLESLDADRDRGDISRETLWEEKKRRGVYSAEFTAERETERLLNEVPSDGEDNDVNDDPPPSDN